MTEDEYCDAISERAPGPDDRASDELVALAREAVNEHPQSTCLLYMLADVLRSTGDIGCTDHIQEVLDLYRAAAAIDPSCPVAHEEIGWVLDIYRDDFALAEESFRRAIALGAGEGAYAGLARVLSQQGKRAEALMALHRDFCPYSTSPEVTEMRGEIARGCWTPYQGSDDEPDREPDPEPDQKPA